MFVGHLDGQETLDDLGPEFVNAVIEAVDGAREDWRDFQSLHADWLPTLTHRTVAGLTHDRIWDHLCRTLEQIPGITILDKEPIHEIHVGIRYVLRVKRHHLGDRISTYPTDAAREFWTNAAETLEGLEFYTLAIGYIWDRDSMTIQEAVLSCRDGIDQPIWAMTLHPDTGSVTGFRWDLVDPMLPDLDLSGIEVGRATRDGS